MAAITVDKYVQFSALVSLVDLLYTKLHLEVIVYSCSDQQVCTLCQ